MSKVVWLTGISGAGKSTLGEKITAFIASKDQKVEYLDGNVVRDFFDNDLGFTEEDRFMAIKRTVFGSHLLAKNGVIAVVSSIAGTYTVRDFIREKLGDMYIQIYVKAKLETVMDRDVRGLYQAHKEGKEKNLPGLSQAYQEPRNPDLVVETDSESIEETMKKIEPFLNTKLQLKQS